MADPGFQERDAPREGAARYRWAYTPALSDREFVAQTVHTLLDCLVRDYPAALTGYLDTWREAAAV